MTPEQLQTMFGMNDYFLNAVTEGVSHEESLVPPQPAGNCLNWVVGHIVFYRNSALALLGQPAVWGEGEGGCYERGSKPIKAGDNVLRLEKLLEAYKLSQERLNAGLARLTPSELAREEEGATLADSLSKWHFHEAYHLGQLGILRRLLGKEGAVG